MLEAFAQESDYEAQSALYDTGTGTDALELAFERVAQFHPGTIVDVGCGTAVFAARLQTAIKGKVLAADLSPRMAKMAADRGLGTVIADLNRLPFASGTVDCLIANWVLHYLENVAAGIREAARVLRPGGLLVAATLSERNLSELWELLFGTPAIIIAFSRENGRRRLKRHFREVDRLDANGQVTFADWAAVRDHLARRMDGAELASRLPHFDGPFLASKRSSVFLARR